MSLDKAIASGKEHRKPYMHGARKWWYKDGNPGRVQYEQTDVERNRQRAAQLKSARLIQAADDAVREYGLRPWGPFTEI